MDTINNSNNSYQLNTNATVENPRKLISIIIDIIYVLFGSLSATTSFLIVFLFLNSKTLRNRKELVLLVGLAVADFILSVGVLIAGSRRLIQNQIFHNRIRRWECIKLFELSLILFGGQASPLITLCISTDRLIAIRWFEFYNGLQRYCYVLCTVGSAFLYTITTYVIGFALFATDRTNYCRYSRMARVSGSNFFKHQGLKLVLSGKVL